MSFETAKETKEPVKFEFIDFGFIKKRHKKIFDKFESNVMKLNIEEFTKKYGEVLDAFESLREQVLTRMDYATNNKGLEQKDFGNALDDIEEIFNVVISILKDDLKNYNHPKNKVENGELIRSRLEKEIMQDIKNKQKIILTFNFKEGESHEGRFGIDYIKHINGKLKKYSLRFDLDKRLNKVVCDLESANLNKIFECCKSDGGDGHHFVMNKLTELVFGGGENREEITSRFSLLVNKFKKFLSEEKHASVNDLKDKFNS